MEQSNPYSSIQEFRNALEIASENRMALIFHLKIDDIDTYSRWLKESANKFGSKRLFRVEVDPVPREGMEVNEIVIDEFPTSKSALDCMLAFWSNLKGCCNEVAVLAIEPEPPATFRMVKAISWIVRLFRGIKDEGVPSAKWKASNTAVWPDQHQMDVARNQNLDNPLFVYNLNKYHPVANYQPPISGGENLSGKEAYDRYAKIAGFELLRRGAFPVYGGKPIGILVSDSDCMLADRWDKFIFVRYPQRRNLLATIESDEFNKGEYHRDAGLERVAIFMAIEI